MKDIVEQIQASGFRACIVITGGGSGAVHEMLSHPGASRFVADVRIPYSREAMQDFLGEAPDCYCSEITARKMAAKALEKGSLAVVCTAALATSQPRADADRAYFGFQTLEKESFQTLEFSGVTRDEQEAELSEALLRQLAQFVAE